MSFHLDPNRPFETAELLTQRMTQRRQLALLPPAWRKRYANSVPLQTSLPAALAGGIEQRLRDLADGYYGEIATDLESRGEGALYRLAQPFFSGPAVDAINDLPNNGAILPYPADNVSSEFASAAMDEAPPPSIENKYRKWITALLLAEALTDGTWLQDMGLSQAPT